MTMPPLHLFCLTLRTQTCESESSSFLLLLIQSIHSLPSLYFPWRRGGRILSSLLLLHTNPPFLFRGFAPHFMLLSGTQAFTYHTPSGPALSVLWGPSRSL